MTEIERKALALVAQLQEEDDGRKYSYAYHFEALCRAIEQHEAFKQEVSDAVEKLLAWPTIRSQGIIVDSVARFIIKPPVDPLVDALEEMGLGPSKTAAEELRAALAARGGRIVFDQPEGGEG